MSLENIGQCTVAFCEIPDNFFRFSHYVTPLRINIVIF